MKKKKEVNGMEKMGADACTGRMERNGRKWMEGME
jgi:hypothetical protein